MALYPAYPMLWNHTKVQNQTPAPMKDKDVIEGNKLIAEFDGWRIVNIKMSGKMSYESKKLNVGLHPEEAQYHSSWDWLRPVIDKIFEYAIAYPEETHKVIDMKIVVNIDAAWEKVVQFIQFYNAQTKQQQQ